MKIINLLNQFDSVFMGHPDPDPSFLNRIRRSGSEKMDRIRNIDKYTWKQTEFKGISLITKAVMKSAKFLLEDVPIVYSTVT